MVTYDEAEARKTDRAYLTPDITRQRMRTLIVAPTKATGSLAEPPCDRPLVTALSA